MALSKVNFNSLNLTPTASKTVVFNSNNNGIEAGDVGGAMVLLSTQTASSSATISFTSGIDSTHKEYIFKFINIHPATNSTKFQFNLSSDSGSNYNIAKTTTTFQSYHYENDAEAILGYDTADDEAQTTGFAEIAGSGTGNGNDEHLTGTFHLFNPSSTTFAKHVISNVLTSGNALSHQTFMAGYGNTTSAIDAVQFKFASGNIDSGTIKMYGVTS